jgi:UDP-N-acetylmuramoylalanine--D-glutamate ligase
MILSKKLSEKSFAVYGLGLTGSSVAKCLKKSKVKNYYLWDDNKKKRDLLKIRSNNFFFLNALERVDYIVISPGINIKKSRFKKVLLKKKHKIITDLDLFYMREKVPKSIVITGTNGKSTTCKIIEQLLKKNNKDVKICGNIGKPILSLNQGKKSFFIIEASSFQLSYAKFIKPDYAIILNISNDHLDWHGSVKNYIDSKLKIFSLQDKNCFAFLSNKILIRKFRSNSYLSKLFIVKSSTYQKIKKNIKNNYLRSRVNEENMSFAFSLSKSLKINNRNFFKSFNAFKGLPHRHEIFYKKKNIKFINDSKATSFASTKFSLQSNNNIFWIVGGLPKLGDKFYLNNLKKKIIKSYIIGKNVNFFGNELKKKIQYEISNTIKNSLISIFKEIKKYPNKNIVVLLSPASASYDQYENFMERGNEFKKLTKLYAKKFF